VRGFVLLSRVPPPLDRMSLCRAHEARESPQESLMIPPGIREGFAVGKHGATEGTECAQMLPSTVVARSACRIAARHQAHPRHAHVGAEALAAEALVRRCPALPAVVSNDLSPIGRPPQRPDPCDAAVLESGTPRLAGALGQRRLTAVPGGDLRLGGRGDL
jgi:hypothetical protein